MQKVKLVDICSPKQWKTIPTSQLKSEGYPVYGANGVIGYFSDYNHEEPTILITCRGATCGSINVCKEFSYVNGNAMSLDNLSRNVDLSFLKYQLENFDFSSVISGSAQPQITREGLQKVVLILFDLQEQKAIAEKLDKVSILIEKRKQQLSLLDTLVKSKFVEMFGGISKQNWVKLCDCCNLITDGTHQPPKFQRNGIPFLFVSNLSNNEINYNTSKFISESTYLELIKRTPIDVGDILLSIVGSYGHPAIVKVKKKFCFQRHIAYMKPNIEKINGFYLHSALMSQYLQEQIEGKVKGVAQKTLNLAEVKTLRLPLPSLDLQNPFADFAEKTEELKAKIKQSLAALELLKKSLMQKYFGSVD